MLHLLTNSRKWDSETIGLNKLNKKYSDEETEKTKNRMDIILRSDRIVVLFSLVFC